MADNEQVITTNDLQRQITALGARMDDGFREIKELFRASDDRIRALENREAALQPMVEAKISAAWREIDAHKVRIVDLDREVDSHQTDITQLQQQNKLLLWLAGTEGAAFLVWAITQVLDLIGK